MSRLRSFFIFTSTISFVLGVTAQYSYATDQLAEDTSSKTQANSFNKQLYDRYIDFADQQSPSRDQGIVEKAKTKALLAGQNKTPAPEQPAQFRFTDKWVAYEINGAYQRLLTVLSVGGSKTAPIETAKAQVAFDCWIYSEVSKNPYLADSCSKDFNISILEATKQIYPATFAHGDNPKIIFDTVYAYLAAIGGETSGYGLYSYVLFAGNDTRSKAFLKELFRASTTARDAKIAKLNLNVVYLPTNKKWNSAIDANNPEPATFLASAYNFPLAKLVLAQFCTDPPSEIRAMCSSDLSKGPYVFTYTKPVTNLSNIPPPFLVLDLSGIDEDAFAEFVAAYKQQVKRENYSDREALDTFRLTLIKIAVPASKIADKSIKKAADIVFSVFK